MRFSRKQWTNFNHCMSIIPTKKDMINIKKIDKKISCNELIEIYFPLAYLLNFYVKFHQHHQMMLKNVLHYKKKIPYIISISGSVSVGKSTTANMLQKLLKLWPTNKKVALITTDGFLHSNEILKKRGLMNKKGFPQSYNIKKLINFISALKSGASHVSAPVYSHVIYDVLPDTEKIIKSPDIVILEGLNVLQKDIKLKNIPNHCFVSNFVDFSIYLHADAKLIKKWYIKRFLNFRRSAFFNSNSYFHHYLNISEKKAKCIAMTLWEKINWINLKENILPTRHHANLIITKSINHTVKMIHLKKT